MSHHHILLTHDRVCYTALVTYGKYAQRVYVHPDRFGSAKTLGPNLWDILHTSEGSEGTSSAENLARYMGNPGDRTTSTGSRYGSSYHVVFDTDQIIPAVPYNVVAFSAAGANSQGVHGCFPGVARQTRTEWLDPVSRAMIRQAAAWLLDIEAQLAIPPVRITPAQMRANQRGLGDHLTVTQAFQRTTHTDVGPHFPWDVLYADIQALRGTPPVPPTPPTPTPNPNPLPPFQGVPDVFTPIEPYRNSDTRGYGGPGVNAGEYAFGLNPDVVPLNAIAVAVNVVAIAQPASKPGFVTVWPGGPRPNTSAINFMNDGQAYNGAAVIGIRNNSVSLFTASQAHLILDITGYWTP